ncbi:FtsX-like permease family protein [Streptomyces sclerotialus]|uniref:FtsX-like permease family protein n=1 Tax=Streptomyces sclerotialus TaxID=1957 RepID=UPI0004C93611
MTATGRRPGGRTTPPAPAPAPPSGAAVRLRDLALGARFAVTGGREGWARTVLTAVGVGLGVALLLAAASVPHLLQSRAERGQARQLPAGAATVHRAADTLLAATADTLYRGDTVHGTLLRPDGSRPPAPPGVTEVPGPGEMVVSPALRELLASPEGALLRDRLDHRITGTIGDAGLVGPAELTYYAGSDTLTTADGAQRLASFGARSAAEPLDPVLFVLLVVACVVLLMPVAIFIATAVRFGGERRDRRLAALRLIGADARTTRRTAAGEALLGAVCGLVVGAGLFLVGRRFIGSVTVWDVNAFPADLTPVPTLAALIVVAVPLAAVAVTLFALRDVTIEPLGVVRQGTARRRRLWWRLPLPVAGLALLLVADRARAGQAAPPFALASGTVLVLLGIALLLPWAVDAVVARFSGGPVPWQLATRRLQLSGGSAARAVSGITVAVAGAIALQMLLTAIQTDFMKVTGQDGRRAQLNLSLPSADIGTTRQMIKDFRRTEGVRGIIAAIESDAARPGPLRKGEDFVPRTRFTVGDCPSLREMARLGSCRDGDVFIVHDGTGMVDDSYIGETARPGAQVIFNLNGETERPDGPPRLWTIPETARTVESRKDPAGDTAFGIFATPSAVDTGLLDSPVARAMVKTDPRVPDAAEYVRNTAARIDPLISVSALQDVERDKNYASVRTGLLTGSAATIVLIAASMLVTMVEQLRERRRLLSVLVAFGTRRATLGWSVLWQTALPVGLGLALAVAGGSGLGVALLRLVGKSGPDWSVLWPPVATGAALVLVVTLAGLPPLWRMMRPDGLRTE